jgi:exoribonuclease-2
LFVLFEEAGKFLAGRVLSESRCSHAGGARLGQARQGEGRQCPAEVRQARAGRADRRGQRLASDIELDLAWEFAPEAEFGFADLARDYFSANGPRSRSRPPRCSACSRRRITSAAPARAASRRRPRKSCSRRWLGIEKKRQQAGADRRLGQGTGRRRCPAPSASSSTRSCSSRTRTAPNTRPWSKPRAATHKAPLDLLQKAGAIDSPYQFHWKRFLFEHFPKGTGLPGAAGARDQGRTAAGRVKAFSIDDSATTEIDDALSVQGLGSGTVTCSASTSPRPALAIQPDSPIDKVARERLSTVYMPGWKLTMLPDEVVQAYTLMAGPRLPGRVAVRHHGRSDAGREGQRNPDRARADRRQPAPRPAGQVVTEAAKTGEAPADRRMNSGPNWPLPSAWPST